MCRCDRRSRRPSLRSQPDRNLLAETCNGLGRAPSTVLVLVQRRGAGGLRKAVRSCPLRPPLSAAIVTDTFLLGHSRGGRKRLLPTRFPSLRACVQACPALPATCTSAVRANVADVAEPPRMRPDLRPRAGPRAGQEALRTASVASPPHRHGDRCWAACTRSPHDFHGISTR
jgi:hypothetical protein